MSVNRYRSSETESSQERSKQCNNWVNKGVASFFHFVAFNVTEGAFLEAHVSDETDAINLMPWTPASGQRTMQRETKVPFTSRLK